jgi:hypothetical protein
MGGINDMKFEGRKWKEHLNDLPRVMQRMKEKGK